MRPAVLNVCTLVLAVLPFGADSQVDSEPLTARFEYRIGGQAFTDFTSVIRLDSATRGVGTEIRLEDDVNLEERVKIARADAFYNFNRRHYVAFAAYNIEREGNRTIARDLRFGEETFPLATFVSSRLEERIGKIAYGYNALVRPRAVLGPSFGLHVTELKAALAVGRQAQADDASTTAPLPVIGVRGQYRFGKRWRLRGALEWFDVQAGDVKGRFSDYIVTVEHDTFARFGFGFGINNLGLDVESGDADFRGAIDLSFHSGVVYVKGDIGGRQRH